MNCENKNQMECDHFLTYSSLKLVLNYFSYYLPSKALAVFILVNLKAILLPEKIMVAGKLTSQMFS